MDFFSEIFRYDFLANAMIASVLSGITCGIIGTYIVCRRLVFLSGGITHSSFGGIGIAYYFGLDPIAGAMVFAILAALGIEYASNKWQIREDSVIGIVWSVGMAIGIIFIYLTPGYAPNLMNYLFGNILTVGTSNIYGLAALSVLLVGIFGLFRRPIMYVAFDREFAASRGVKTGLISSSMAVLTAVAIVLSIRVVGIVLLISLLTIPAAIANSLTKSFDRILVWAVALAIAGNVAGLYISYKLDIPAGATTIFLLTLTLIIVKLLPLWSNKKIVKA